MASGEFFLSGKIITGISELALDWRKISATAPKISVATCQMAQEFSAPVEETSQMSQGILKMSGEILEAGAEICPPAPAISKKSRGISGISPAIS